MAEPEHCQHPDVVEFESQRHRCNVCRVEVDVVNRDLSVYDQRDAAEIRAEFAERALAAAEKRGYDRAIAALRETDDFEFQMAAQFLDDAHREAPDAA